ncbi:SixA phosphatase family protein [Microbacterium sp. NPDC055683]
MLRLLLLRHAKSDWPQGVGDGDRPLTARGERDARAVGEVILARGFTPDAALVSPARRTRETWSLASAAWPAAPESSIVDDVYLASSRRLLQVVREHGGSVRTLLLVGHNPGIHDLVDTLAAPDQRSRVPLDFPTATLAVLDLPVDHWIDLAPQTATVTDVVSRGT